MEDNKLCLEKQPLNQEMLDKQRGIPYNNIMLTL